MYQLTSQDSDAILEWAGRTRGGGAAAVGLLVNLTAGSVSGGGSLAFSLEAVSSTASAASVQIQVNDDSSYAILRNGNTASTAVSSPLVADGSAHWLWIDIGALMVDGTNPLSYYDGAGSWNNMAPSGATDVVGAAKDINGYIRLTLYSGLSGGLFKLGPIFIWTGVLRPDDASKARAIALADGYSDQLAQAQLYAGLCFAWNGASLVDNVSGAMGTNTAGTFDNSTQAWRIRERHRFR